MSRQGWTGRPEWRIGVVEIGLLATVGAVFLSAAAVAPYRHPALLIGWEWLGLFAAYYLTRQLVRTESDQRGLLAAVVATAVSIAAYTVYQSTIELEQLRNLSPEQLQAALAKVRDAVREFA